MSQDASRLPLVAFLEAWDAEARPLHCSNCRHARVWPAPPAGDSSLMAWPSVACEVVGEASTLWRLCREKAPHGFRQARLCPDFVPAGP